MIINTEDTGGQEHRMEAFGRLHPAVLTAYYVGAVVLMICVGTPWLSLLVGGLCLVDCMGFFGWSRAMKKLVSYLGVAAVCVVFNPLLNHRGVTLLFMLGDWRITRESLFYGIHMAGVMLTTLLLFSCMSYYLTSEKIMTLLGNRFPSIALVFSMVLRIVPKVARDFLEMRARLGNSPGVFSALIGLTMEDAMERGLSMRSRSYGTGKRSSFYKRTFSMTDRMVLCGMVMMILFIIISMVLHPVKSRFYPSIHITALPWYLWLCLLFYYCIPLFFRGKEEISWYLSRRTITDSGIREENRML